MNDERNWNYKKIFKLHLIMSLYNNQWRATGAHSHAIIIHSRTLCETREISEAILFGVG